MTFIHPVIMVGGSGTRLWPMSTPDMPKQFQILFGNLSLFQNTVKRVSGQLGSATFRPPIIIGAARFQDIIKQQLKEIGVEAGAIILEPCARNTAAVAAVAAQIVDQTDQGLALLVPADHYISDVAAFRTAIDQSITAAQNGWISTFGVTPTYPATGYGYIKAGEPIDKHVSQIATFCEKPDLKVAQSYLDEKQYFWNTGIFLFSPNTMMNELSKHAQDILHTTRTALQNCTALNGCKLLEETSFSKCTDISIDYAIMEKTAHAAVVPGLECGWSDVGSWDAIAKLNTDSQPLNIVSIDNAGCHIQTDDKITIAAIGLDNLIIAANADKILIIPKDRAQDVQKIINELKDRKLY